MYHLYFGDETGHPGSVMTFFEIPGALPGRPGAGMVHETRWRVRDAAALDFWAARLTDAGIATERDDATLRFADPEGLGLALRRRRHAGRAAGRGHADIPAEHALLGFEGASAYSTDAGALDRDARPACPASSATAPAWRRAGRPRLDLALRPGAGRRPAGRAPAPSTTSPGRRAPPSRRSGSPRSRPPAIARARSWTARTSGRSTSASPRGVLFEIATDGARLRHRRARRDARQRAAAAAAVRGPPDGDRGPPTPAEEPARCGLPRVTSRSPRATG